MERTIDQSKLDESFEVLMFRDKKNKTNSHNALLHLPLKY